MPANFPFSVGDRVECVGDQDGNTAIIGGTGTVVYISHEERPLVSVDFDDWVHSGLLHSGEGGKGRRNRCWNFRASYGCSILDKLQPITSDRPSLDGLF